MLDKSLLIRCLNHLFTTSIIKMQRVKILILQTLLQHLRAYTWTRCVFGNVTWLSYEAHQNSSIFFIIR